MPASKSASQPCPSKPTRVVIKLGTGVLTTGIGQLNMARIRGISAQVSTLRKQGVEVIIVSSGAVGLGMGALALGKRPKEVSKKQACAAIGQSRLMQIWQEGLGDHGLTTAQVLLTHDDLRVRGRYLGVKETLRQLIAYQTIPVINENDTVSAAEIKFGDNDTLSAMVASLVEASHLFIISTAPGLIDMKGSGKIVPVVERITPEIEAMAGGTSSETAVGGMISKISAAKVAVKAGCGVFIASGAEENIVPRLLAGEAPGTFFVPSGLKMEARKRWLAHFQRPRGRLSVDDNAVKAIVEGGHSLLAVGVSGGEGHFDAGEVVDIAGPSGRVVARGKSGFSSDEIAGLAGLKSAEMARLYPERKRLEVVHRNDLVLL
jgi:glutamate 5-kinase